MCGFSWLQLPKGSSLRPHIHIAPQVVMLISGEVTLHQHNIVHEYNTQYLKAPNYWFSPPNSCHSGDIKRDTILVTIPLPCGIGERKLPTWSILFSLFASLNAFAAQPCSFNVDDIDKLIQSDYSVEIPDCFFENLEASASSGDSQAQVNLGICYLEDLISSGNPAIGTYWLRKAIDAGHPSAQYLLDSYLEDYAC